MTGRVELERDLFLALLEIWHIEQPQQALQGVLSLAVKTVAAEKGYLEIYSDQSHVPIVMLGSGMDEARIAEARNHVSRGIIAEALVRGQVLQIESALLDERFAALESVQRRRIEAVLCAPIGAAPILGVLYLAGGSGGGAFSRDDEAVFKVLLEHLAPVVRRIVEAFQNPADATAEARRSIPAPGLIGKSRPVARVLDAVSTIAAMDVAVLLRGPSGTGKTLIARTIHEHSPRAQGPFVHLNCANLPETLVESELFGTVKGGHSMAHEARKGKVAAADGGTLFLDEIADMPPGVQAKLLTLVQSGRFYPLGSDTESSSDFRLITATNADLEQAVEEKKFRGDLFYRINRFPIRLPTLAERPSDIPLLARHFVEAFAQKQRLPVLTLSLAALFTLETQEWIGNVRELESFVEAAYIRALRDGADPIEPRHFHDDHDEGVAGRRMTFREATRQFQRGYVQQALEETDWNMKATAENLDIARSHLYNLIRTLGLER